MLQGETLPGRPGAVLLPAGVLDGSAPRRGRWRPLARLIDVVLLPLLVLVVIFWALGRYERIRAERPPVVDGKAATLHVVQPGDNLRALAARYYGDPNAWPELWHANRERLMGKRLQDVRELVIPPR